VAIKPGESVINDHLGDAYWAAGRKLEARFQWNHALAGADVDPAEKLKIRAKITKAEQEDAAAKAAHLAAFEKALLQEPAVPQAKPLAADKKAATDAENGTQVAAIPETITVADGQSLWTIAVEVYGDGSRFADIVRFNPQLQGDPSRLQPGQVLKLPR
jgi:nucleoid-associated protein YgaU